MSTLEQRLKAAARIGRTLVTVTYAGRSVVTLVDISPRGVVRYLVKPTESTMYSGWHRIRGDVTKPDGGVIVWGARDPSIMEMFDGLPVATVELQP